MSGRRDTTFSPKKLISKTRRHLRTPTAFQDSIDEANPVDIDYKANPWWRSRYLCWEVKGQIAEEYKTLGPKIYEELGQSCRESSLEVFVWPYMVGKSAKNARPVLVIASEDETSREEAKATIERSNILQEYPHFKLWPLRYLPTGPVNPVAMEDHPSPQPLPPTESFEVYYDPADRLRPIGMPICIKHGPKTVRRATANAVHNGTDHGYLTAAHALMRTNQLTVPFRDTQHHFEFPFGSDSDSDDSTEMEASSLYSGTSPEPTETDSSSTAPSQHSEVSSQSSMHKYEDSTTRHESPSPVEPSVASLARPNSETHSTESLFSTELELLGTVSISHVLLDYAIVHVTNKAVISFLEGLKNVDSSSRETVKVSQVRRAKITAWTSRGPVQGNLLDLPLCMRLAGSPSFQQVYKFMYHGDISMGDCGTLLIDTETKEVYGHVVADSQRRQVAFMMSAESVFGALKRDGNWQLLTQDAEATSLTSNELWQGLVLQNAGPDHSNHLFRGGIAPTNEHRLESSQSLATMELEDALLMQRAIPVPPSTVGSLSTRRSSSRSSEHLPYTTTVASSFGDRYELSHPNSFEPIDPSGFKGQKSKKSSQVDHDQVHRSQPMGFSLAKSPSQVSYSPKSASLRPIVPKSLRHRYPLIFLPSDEPLTSNRRTHSVLMQGVASCFNCERRGGKCDSNTPCNSCLDHYKERLINQPCRKVSLPELTNKFMGERVSWIPGSRVIETFIPSDSFQMDTERDHTISLIFGFGPGLQVSIHGLELTDTNFSHHTHYVYAWPPKRSGNYQRSVNLILPAILTSDAETNLQHLLDTHLSTLVMEHFRSFPLYYSPLSILRDVYIFFRSLPSDTPHSLLLMKALKLLVLVHVDNDINLPDLSTDAALDLFVRTTMTASDSYLEPDLTLTPCFIRAQLGTATQYLGFILMKDVLSSLEKLLIKRDYNDWPTVLATLLIVFMAIESVQYHAAKLPCYIETVTRRNFKDSSENIDEGAKKLLAFYTACYPCCHAKLDPDWKDDSGLGWESTTAESTFIESIRDATKSAYAQGYLTTKSAEQQWDGEDMAFFFDRRVARLLLTKTEIRG
jgi:hypothetical protein